MQAISEHEQAREGTLARPAISSIPPLRWLRDDAFCLGCAIALVNLFCAIWLLLRPDLFWQDDMMTQYLPASQEVARAVWQGELPLLTPYAFYGAPLAAEYQHAAFSLFEVLLAAGVWALSLSLPSTAAVLGMVHLTVLAAGSYRLARSRGAEPGFALLVPLVVCFNGWLMNWGVTWYPSLTGFAWLPWAWWALERALERDAKPWLFARAAFFIYLVLTAGWLYSCAMMVLVSGWLVARELLSTPRRVAWQVAAAWVLALGLAAPAFTTLAEYAAATQRGESGIAINRYGFVPLEGLLGMAIPSYAVYWHFLFSVGVRRSVELAGALTPATIWLAALSLRGRALFRQQWSLLLLLGLCTVLMMSPAVYALRFSFRLLPLWHLVLALCAADALSAASDEPEWQSRALSRTSKIACAMVAFTWARALLIGLDVTGVTLRLGGVLTALFALWVGAEWWLRRTHRWSPIPLLLTTMVSLAATYHFVPPNSEVPRWMVGDPAQPGPFDRSRRYLSLWAYNDLMRRDPTPGRTGWAINGAGMLPGYTALHAQVPVLHGYSPMGERGLKRLMEFEIHAEIPPRHIHRILKEEARGGGLLKLAAVDGLIVYSGYGLEIEKLEAHGWGRVAQVSNAIVLHRQGPRSPRVRAIRAVEVEFGQEAALDRVERREAHEVPLVLTSPVEPKQRFESFADAQVELVSESRLTSVARVAVPAGQQEALISFARPWLPGWQAQLGGRELELEVLDGFLPAVRVPAGLRGELTLSYSPRGLWVGLVVAGTTLLLALAAVALMKRRWRAQHAPA